MPLTISEDYLSRPFTIGRDIGRELIYHLVGSEDEEAVRTLLEATAPAAYLGLALDSIEAQPEGRGKWKGFARYVKFDNDSEYTFDTTGGTSKITQSLATIASYAPPGFVAPDFRGAIGVGDDRVEGVDITIPAFAFTETHSFNDAFILGGYKSVLFNMTGRTNNAPFKGLATGEALFLGATGSKRGDEKWSINFRFAGSPNETGLTVGDITGVAKGGWQYLWVRYADFVDSFAFSLVKRPVACYVEQVYKPGDYSSLLIGV
jgi:hypothetical protein